MIALLSKLGEAEEQLRAIRAQVNRLRIAAFTPGDPAAVLTEVQSILRGEA